MSDLTPGTKSEHDPRSVSDEELREEYSREEVQKWRDDAQSQHERWLDVMNNEYGKK
ncbi:hypothetical protein [Alkalilimnicola ehrlichii]|uniref:hypothetical protein n=1 Tax=Alkalilimnicola ehrlichii TaxID=351052 RepID=UPI0015F24B8E|nr:hypothetical protein [Alkalilimnicola ehrlichii]